jgi:hypothetical protein
VDLGLELSSYRQLMASTRAVVHDATTWRVGSVSASVLRRRRP